MKRLLRLIFLSVLSFLFVFMVYKLSLNKFKSPSIIYEIGEEIDSFNAVPVFYNGSMRNVDGRALTTDGYNLGLKYQCVEFVKRYYYEVYAHKMPNSYGHAKDFFQKSLKDGKINRDRNLLQFTNPSSSKPKVGDLLVFDRTVFNKYGHVAIISEVNADNIELIQQNTGRTTRKKFGLSFENKKWKIEKSNLLGWLRMKD